MEAGQVGLSGVSVVQSAVRDTKEGIEDVTIPLQDGVVPCVRDLTSNEQSVPPFVQVCILWMIFGFAFLYITLFPDGMTPNTISIQDKKEGKE